MEAEELQELRQRIEASERRRRWQAALWVVVPAAIGLGWLGWSASRVVESEERYQQIEGANHELLESNTHLEDVGEALASKNGELGAGLRKKEAALAKARRLEDDLRRDNEQILEFFKALPEEVAFVHPDIAPEHWQRAKEAVVAQKGQRRLALLVAMLVAYQHVRVRGGAVTASFKTGMSAPQYVALVLKQVGIAVERPPGKGPTLGKILQDRFPPLPEREAPLAGDLMFYRCPGPAGEPYTVPMFYLSEGRPEGKGIAIGAVIEGRPLEVLDSADIPASARFVGYGRVPYDE